MADYKDIAGRIRTTAADGIVVESQEIIDLQNGKTQQEINSDVQTELNDRYTKEETYSQEQLDSMITTPDVNYVSVVATDQTTAVTDVLPAEGEADTIYRVGNWDGTQYDATVYSLYSWNGTNYVCLAVRSFVCEVYDISANHPDGQGNPTEYADLAAALGTDGMNVPDGIRRGGMSVKFVQSDDNNYVRFNYLLEDVTTASTFTNVSNWQGVDADPTSGSHNLVESGSVYFNEKCLEINSDLLVTSYKDLVVSLLTNGANYGTVSGNSVTIPSGTNIGGMYLGMRITSASEIAKIKGNRCIFEIEYSISGANISPSSAFTDQSSGGGVTFKNSSYRNGKIVVEAIVSSNPTTQRIGAGVSFPWVKLNQETIFSITSYKVYYVDINADIATAVNTEKTRAQGVEGELGTRVSDIEAHLESSEGEVTNYSILSSAYIAWGNKLFVAGTSQQSVRYVQVTQGERYYISDKGHRVDANNANSMLAVFSANTPSVDGTWTTAIQKADADIDMAWTAPSNGYLCFFVRSTTQYVSIFKLIPFLRLDQMEENIEENTERLDELGDVEVQPLDVSDFFGEMVYSSGTCTIKSTTDTTITVNSGTAIHGFAWGYRMPLQAEVFAGIRLKLTAHLDIPSDLKSYASANVSVPSGTVHSYSLDKENGILTAEFTASANSKFMFFGCTIWGGTDNIFQTEHTFAVGGVEVVGVKFQDNVEHAAEVKCGGKKGLKMSCVGDSYTLSNTGNANYPHQWERVVKYLLGLDSFEVKAVHGGVLTTGGYLEITEIQEDADIITFWYGTNDYANNITLGTINDSAVSPSTFYGALKYVFEWVSTNRPNAIFIPITHTRRYASTTDITFINNNGRGANGEPLNNVGKTLGDYTNAIKEVAMLYAYDVLDLHDISGVNENNESSFYVDDHLHPSPTNITKIGKKIARFISNSEIR